MTDPTAAVPAPEPECPKSADGHCDHWWDDSGPCCRCGDDTGAGLSDAEPGRTAGAQTGCAFCHRIEVNDYCGEARGVVSFEPLNPVTEGHRLFVPRMHVASAGHAPWVAANVFEVAADYAHRAGGDYNLITSAGAAATQTVWHLHVHVVPRTTDDGLHLPWTGQLKTEASRG